MGRGPLAHANAEDGQKWRQQQPPPYISSVARDKRYLSRLDLDLFPAVLNPSGKSYTARAEALSFSFERNSDPSVIRAL
jgi:hypothetical protein